MKISVPTWMLRLLHFGILDSFLVLGCYQVRGELPFPKCKVALDSVIFSEQASNDQIASNFADIVTQMAQDVSSAAALLLCYC